MGPFARGHGTFRVLGVRMVGLDDLAIERLAGDLGRPRVILVHGAMDRSTSLRTLARLLQPREVVLYDRRGYARSLGAPGGGFYDHVEDLAELVAERPCVVFGHSLGGTYALAVAARQPDTLRAVSVFESPLSGHSWFGDWVLDRESLQRGGRHLSIRRDSLRRSL
ncbi:MAG: alpha/beta hydrolase [Ferrimicrobium sp.]